MMQLQVLGCSGAIAQGAYTSAFVIDGVIALDAGTGLGQLPLEAMLAIDHIFLSHAHLDHIAALPLLLDSVMLTRSQQKRPPVRVYALAETLHALRKHIFNRVIWPDFSTLPSRQAPVVEFIPVELGQTITCANLPHQIEVLPAVHTVAAVAYAVRPQAQTPALVYTGDTGPNPKLWQRLAHMDLAALIIETAFSSQEAHVARAALHLSPASLADELLQMAPGSGSYPIYITHTKPAQAALIQEEVRRLVQADSRLQKLLTQHPLYWLQCSQTLEI